MKRVVVIGAGASGLMAAIAAAREGAAVTLLEKMEKPGKKLLITGNGRCNMTNMQKMDAGSFRGAGSYFIQQVIDQLPVDKTIALFHSLGLLTRDRGGYVYPYTDQAVAVADTLLLEIRRLKVKLKCREEVTALERTGEEWLVRTRTWKYSCDSVVLCAGGQAAPQTGSDGSGYELAKSVGHSIRTVIPALVPLKVADRTVQMMSGTRSQVHLQLESGGEVCARESGELQWTDYGVSGIVVFQLSRYAVDAIRKKIPVKLHVDLLPELTLQQAVCFLKQKQEHLGIGTAEELLTGVLQKKAVQALMRSLGRKPGEKLSELEIEEVVLAAKDLTLNVTGFKSFEMAQVCAGGVATEQVRAATLESRRAPGLFLAGELLDVDGICGGYNLQWAWSSGWVAGREAAR